MRLAITQFATTLNTQQNLATCIRVINKAAQHQPTLIVLPEFANTVSWLKDQRQAWQQALEIDGYFLQAIAEQAQQHSCYIVIHVTLRAGNIAQADLQNQSVCASVCLFSPQGELIYPTNNAQPSAHDLAVFAINQSATNRAGNTQVKLGLMPGGRGLAFNAAQVLSLQGAQLLCCSSSANSREQIALFEPARAWQNQVFVATSNKIGCLAAQKSQLTDTEQVLYNNDEIAVQGYGYSQIIAPNGQVLAQIAHREEGIAFADIDVSRAGLTQYRQVSENIALQYVILDAAHLSAVPETLNVAIFATYKSMQQAIEDVCHYIENNLTDIIQLPELFFLTDKNIAADKNNLASLADISHSAISRISAVLRPLQYVCTSLIIEGYHQAVLISADGLIASQSQLQYCQRYPWSEPINSLNIITLPFEQGSIKLAMLTGDDAINPEIVAMAAKRDIALLLVPFDLQTAQESDFNLLAIGAEHKLCLIVASREKSFINAADNASAKANKSTGFIANFAINKTSLTQLTSARFANFNRKTLIKQQHGKITKALVFPATKQ
ncbi:Predicted amidohydrolase [Colwellia chukchiensis]|uniref:Predicted amidohydrolase n=1 Tax=Colwellia chukchiensis TaxID=641665 RepID=A0A1H7MSV9_9GAMM|nr:nitrilase-related carbon-nitrogen hydrolase [Colwellia chukchiensis]SEL13755.1 Predicted amidohydrolase [Colwellia chukchiensis]